MDANAINTIIVREVDALKKLLELLDEQHDLLIKGDVMALEEIISRIELCNKDVAQAELDRRNLLEGAPMKEVLDELNNEELSNNYRIVKRVIHEIGVQKETNDMLIKMGLGFSTRMLKIINPERTPKTYNSYGKLKG